MVANMVVLQRLLSLLFTIIILLLNINTISAFSYRDITAKKRYQEHIINSAIDFPSNDEDHLLPSLPSLLFDARRSIFNRRYCCLILRSSSGDGDKKQKGYRFGDITKSLIGGRVEKVT